MNKTREDIAWENAIEIYTEDSDCEETLEPNQEKACYLCADLETKKIKMNKGTHCSKNSSKKCWNIDHVDGNTNNNNSKNLVATHRACNEEKGDKNLTNQYNRIKKHKICI